MIVEEEIKAALKEQILKHAYVHEGISCVKCGTRPIKGTRYKCFVCSDFNLCEFCETQANEHTLEHAFLKIRRPEADPNFIKGQEADQKVRDFFENENPVLN